MMSVFSAGYDNEGNCPLLGTRLILLVLVGVVRLKSFSDKALPVSTEGIL
jgi:hypothetical protein